MTQRFGTNASFDESAGTLTIKLSDLGDQANGGDITNGLGLDSTAMTDANKDQYSSRIIWALLQLNNHNQLGDNNDETVGIYITNRNKQNATRNQVAQVGFQLLTTAYINDTLGVNLDPDSIGA